MQRLTLIAFAFVLESLTLWPSAAFAEQPKPTATPGISSPRAEPPLDPFAVAVYSESTSPYFVLVTIVDDRTGVSWQVCTKAEALVGAMMTEWQWSYENNARRRAAQRIIANATRTYHLSNPKALANVAPRYTEAQLATVRERLKSYSTAELVKLFGPCGKDNAYWKRGEPLDPFTHAAAHVLAERGLSVRMADITGRLIALTTEELVRRQRLGILRAEATGENAQKSMALARRLPGYSLLTKKFRVMSAITMCSTYDPNVLHCVLITLHAAMVDEVSWFNPIVGSLNRYGWTVFLRNYEHVAELASRLHWLQLWKLWAGGQVSFAYYGMDGSISKYDLPIVRSAWRRAGLTGSPECEISLYRKDVYLADIYLSARSKKSLIYNFRDSYEASRSRAGLMALRPAIRRRIGVTFRRIAGFADYYVAVPVRRRR